MRRRDLLAGAALTLLGSELARGTIVAGSLPWHAGAANPPREIHPGPWQFFTPLEAAMAGVFADRMIPPDAAAPGGRDAGCVVFIDRQLAGPYGRGDGLYEGAPFQKGTQQQGDQSPLAPAELYRTALAALDLYCREMRQGSSAGKPLAELSAQQQDQILQQLEDGSLTLPGVDGKTFFEAVLKDVQQGFFADPIYGGNRDMCAWKMIGFPGARYDYRDWVGRHNERYPHPPVSIGGRSDWTPKAS